MPDEIPIVCIGAQRSGTTWMHRVLSFHPEIGMARIKEINHFNAPDQRYRFRQMKLDRIPELLTSGDARMLRRADNLIKAAAIETDADYLHYLRQSANGKRAFGDFSPSYAHLGAGEFKHLLSVLPNARLLFILRDPVDRYISQLRLGTNKDQAPKEPFSIPTTYSHYAATLDVLDEVKPPFLKVVLFEELMEDQERVLTDILDFIGVAPVVTDRMRNGMVREINVRVKQEPPPPATIAALRSELDETYRRVAAMGFSTQRYWKHANAS